MQEDAIFLKNESDLVAKMQNTNGNANLEKYVAELDMMVVKKLKMYKDL